MTTKADFAEVRFKVCEWGDGTPYVGTLEGGPSSNAVLNEKTSFLMTLQDGTTMKEAEALVDHLNRLISQISIQQH